MNSGIARARASPFGLSPGYELYELGRKLRP